MNSAARRNYYYWLVFISALFIAIDILRRWTLFAGYGLYWLDVLATYALFGVGSVILSFIGAALLAWLERLGRHLGLSVLTNTPRGTVFILFLIAWLSILMMLVLTNFEELRHAWGYLPDAVSGVLFMTVVSIPIGLGTGFIILFRHGAKVFRWMDETAPRLRVIGWLLITVYFALLGYLFVASLDQGERSAVAPTGAAEQNINVFIIILDALAAKDMSLYGYRLPTTPQLAQLTESWTVYENAHSTSNGTLVAMPTILTGRYPYLREMYRYGDLARQGNGWLNLAEALQVLGYQTACITAVYLPGMYHLQTGFDEISYNSKSYLGFLYLTPFTSLVLLDPATGFLELNQPDRPAAGMDVTLDYTLEYLHQKSAAGTSRPFFIYTHSMGVHGPPYRADEFLGTFLPVEEGLLGADQRKFYGRPYSPEEQPAVDKLRLRYDESILRQDREITEFIAELKELDLYDNSLIIITADHGQSFSLGYQSHGTPLLSVAEDHVPLLIKYPYQVEGRRVKELVSLVDIAPTVLDVLGVSRPAWVDGQSLLTLDEDHDRVIYGLYPYQVPSGDPPITALSGKLKIVHRQGQAYFYDITKDPAEPGSVLEKAQHHAGLEEALEQFYRRTVQIQNGTPVLAAPALQTRLPNRIPIP